jgi:hypothetical protein
MLEALSPIYDRDLYGDWHNIATWNVVVAILWYHTLSALFN